MKKILIISKMLNSGGVEVSLLNFIKALKKNDNLYIRLLLLKNSGPYYEEFNSIVDIDEINFVDNLYNPASNICEFTNPFLKIKKIIFKICDKYNISFINKLICKKTIAYEGEWDLVIDFHGYGFLGTTYMVEKVNAKVKCTFIHDEKMNWMKKNKSVLNKIDYFFAVSEHCKDIFKQKYKKLSQRTITFHNILDEEKIKQMSEAKIDCIMDGKLNLLTIGRLTKQKGYDILLKSAKILKEQGVPFKWYIIGQGTLEKKIKSQIISYDLANNIVMLGLQKNPYPFIKKCDIYVQTSIHEGYGIAIAEARILEKPIIASNLKPIAEQIKNNHTGMLSSINPEEFAKYIILLYNNKELMGNLSTNLMNENNKKNNDLDIIYSIMGG